MTGINVPFGHRESPRCKPCRGVSADQIRRFFHPRLFPARLYGLHRNRFRPLLSHLKDDNLADGCHRLFFGGMTASIPCFSARARISSLLWPLSAKSLSAANPSIGAIARAQSAVTHCVTKALTGMPCTIRSQMQFCVEPPFARIMSRLPSLAPARMWVNPAMAGIDHRPCRGRLINRNFRRPLPHVIIAPTGAASTGGAAPSARVGWSASAHNPEDRIDKAPVVASPAAPASFTVGQTGIGFFPN